MSPPVSIPAEQATQNIYCRRHADAPYRDSRSLWRLDATGACPELSIIQGSLDEVRSGP